MLTFLYDKTGRRWRWWIQHRNGRIMAYGRHRGYARKEDCLKAMHTIRANIWLRDYIVKQGRP